MHSLHGARSSAPGNGYRAPALSQSSSAKRRLPSGHRSPAGTTATDRSPAQRATAAALRSDPATTAAAPRACAMDASVEPFGDGNTRRRPSGTFAYDAGESVKPGSPRFHAQTP